MAPSLRSLATAAIGMMRCPQGAAAGVLVGVAVAMYKRHKSSKGPAPEVSAVPYACNVQHSAINSCHAASVMQLAAGILYLHMCTLSATHVNTTLVTIGP